MSVLFVSKLICKIQIQYSMLTWLQSMVIVSDPKFVRGMGMKMVLLPMGKILISRHIVK